MALKGTLKDFSLADILQLIGIQRKTGVLNLHGSDDRISISFIQGSIVSAESATKRLEDRVATVLVKWGHCTPDQLKAARLTQQQTLERLWTILLAQKAVSNEEVRQALQLQVERIIYPVFRWTDGEYSFIQEANIDFDGEHMTPIHSESVLMEGVRMLDEWPLLERKLRSADTVFSRASLGEKVVVDGDAVDEGGDEANQIRLSGEEYAIYDLVDGVLSAEEIQELSPTHDFNTASVLATLLGLGLITPSGDGRTSTGELDSMPAGDAGRQRRVIIPALAGLVVAALLLFAVPRLHLNPVNILVRGLTDGDRSARLVLLRETSRTHQLEELLEAYRLEHGAYPLELEELVDSGFAGPGAIVAACGVPFAYTSTGEGFTLDALPERPAGAPGLPDDPETAE